MTLKTIMENKFMGIVIFIPVFYLVVAVTPTPSVKTPAPSVDGNVNYGEKPMNVDYILNLLASGVPQQKPHNAFEGIRLKRQKKETYSFPRETFLDEAGVDRPIPVSGGPGWVEIRLPRLRVQHPHQHTVKYRPQGHKKSFAAAPVRFVRRRWRGREGPPGPLLSVPLTPCPSWVTRDQFCLLLADNVRVDQSRFAVYEVQITTTTIDDENDTIHVGSQSCASASPENESQAHCDVSENQTRYYDDVESKNLTRKATFKFTFRLWNCDPTLKNTQCRGIGKSLGIGVPAVQEMESSPIAKVEVLGIYIPYDWAMFMRRFWPLYVVLVAFMLVVGLPLIFFRAKRVAEREVLLHLFSQQQMITALVRMRRHLERATQGG